MKPRSITPQARALLSALDASDRDTFRRLWDHFLAAASEGFCPLCSRALTPIHPGGSTPPGNRVPWCPDCRVVWDVGEWQGHIARMLAWPEDGLDWWARAWKATFLSSGNLCAD